MRVRLTGGAPYGRHPTGESWLGGESQPQPSLEDPGPLEDPREPAELLP
jgi:hypothetical protein